MTAVLDTVFVLLPPVLDTSYETLWDSCKVWRRIASCQCGRSFFNSSQKLGIPPSSEIGLTGILPKATLATLFDTIALRCVLEEVPRFLRPESVDACPDLRIHFKAIVLLTESHELDRIVEAGLGIPGGGYTREVEEDIEDLSWGTM